jgi:hypothetical protein
MRIHRQVRPLVGEGCSIKIIRRDRDDVMWLSGLPYLFTGYAERAFVFTRHGEELKYQCRVHEWAT